MRSQPKIIYKDLLIYTAQLSMARFILAGNPGGGGLPYGTDGDARRKF